MTDTKHLPSVHFDRVGDVTAAEAVVVIDGDVWIRHPHGGRILVGLSGVDASEIQDVLTAWATLSAEATAESDTTLARRFYAAKLEAGRRGHALAGTPRCLCGQEFNSPADLDYHLIAEASER